jgi:hypothetical protein
MKLGSRHWQAIHALLRKRDNSVSLGPAWQQIHEELEVGERRGNRLHFSDEMLSILRQAAESKSGAELLVAATDITRLEAARQGFIDEKNARQRPDDGYVLVKGTLPAPLLSLSPELSQRVPVSRLDLDAIKQIVVIENLDSFDDWQYYAAPVELADSLLLYRGHGGLARGTRRLLASLPAATHVIVFPDYDPAGLSIAIGLPRADALLVPALDEQLLAKGSREHFARQSRQASHLDASQLDGWQAVWTAMKEQQVSIKQQHMLALDTPLRLVRRNSR